MLEFPIDISTRSCAHYFKFVVAKFTEMMTICGILKFLISFIQFSLTEIPL